MAKKLKLVRNADIALAKEFHYSNVKFDGEEYEGVNGMIVPQVVEFESKAPKADYQILGFGDKLIVIVSGDHPESYDCSRSKLGVLGLAEYTEGGALARGLGRAEAESLSGKVLARGGVEFEDYLRYTGETDKALSDLAKSRRKPFVPRLAS